MIHCPSCWMIADMSDSWQSHKPSEVWHKNIRIYNLIFRPSLSCIGHLVKRIPVISTSMCLMMIILPTNSNLLLSYVGIVFLKNERYADKSIINTHRKPDLIRMGLNPMLRSNLGPPRDGEERTLRQLVDTCCVSLSRFDTILCIIRITWKCHSLE